MLSSAPSVRHRGEEHPTMARGSVRAEGSYAQVSSDPKVVEAYMGTADTELASPAVH